MKTIRIVSAASSALFLSLGACAGGPHPDVRATQAAATDSSIHDARARLSQALHAWEPDSLDRLMAADSAFTAQVMGLSMSRAELVAFTKSKAGADHPSMVVSPRQSEYCVGAGYETGTFGYRPTSDESVAGRYGSYAIAWTTESGSALLKTVIIDSAPDPRRIGGRVSCETWRSVQLRSRRTIISVTPVIDHQGIPHAIFDDLNASGWNKGWADQECSAIGDRHLDYANTQSAIDLNSVVHPDALAAFIDARFLVGERTELEVAGTPKAVTSCSTGYNPSNNTGVSSFFTARTYVAYVSRRFGDLRIGVGPTLEQTTVSMRQANVNSQNPGRGGVTGELGRVSTSKLLPGLGAVAGYTLTLGGGLVADLNVHISRGTSLSLPALPSYTPKSVAASSYQLGVSLGWAR
jgi:hypothetical protein